MAKTADPEEEYFAKLEKLRKEELREKVEAKEKVEKEAARKQAHWMKCPKCGADLKTEVHRGVEIDACAACGGIFLDAGELEALAGAPSVGKFFRGLLAGGK